MRFAKTCLILTVLGLTIIGCSNSRQHKDSSWTAKPANMQVVFTAPAVMDTLKESSTDWPIFPWYYTSENRLPAAGPSALPIATKDSLMLPDEMKKMSEWFSSNVDNTLKFNSNVHYKVSEISKDEVSYSEQVADGENLRVPMPKSMDSAEVYMVLDSIQLKSYVSLREGAGTTMASVGMTVGAMVSNNCVQISALYAFYDAKTAKRLDYGFLEEKQCADQTVIEHDWQNVLRELILRAIDKTPIAQF